MNNPIYLHYVLVSVYNKKTDGVGWVTKPTVIKSTWVVSKCKTLWDLNNSELDKRAILRRCKSKSAFKGTEKLVIDKITKTIETNVGKGKLTNYGKD